MRKKKAETHQINDLEQRVRNSYIRFQRNQEYPLGEIDLIGFREDGYWDIFEVKSTMGHYDKAIDQLRRAKNYFHREVMDCYIYIAAERGLYKV